MLQYVIKVLISAILIVAISEIAKRSTLFGAALASVPLVSVIAIIWLYHDTHDVMQIANLASNVFWLVIPSLVLFILLPIFLLKLQWSFYPALTVSLLAMVGSYLLMTMAIKAGGCSHFV
ncbi:MAG: DUF3147 family protein [Gammaproteobacteria bacterium]